MGIADETAKTVIDLVGKAIDKDRRIALRQREVVIGTHQIGPLAVDIRADIVLGETFQPNPGIFLERVRLERPYCTSCSRPLEASYQGTWMSAGLGGPDRYQCTTCATAIDKSHDDLESDVHGAIRRDFLVFWNRYQDEIRSLTGGEPHKYKLADG